MLQLDRGKDAKIFERYSHMDGPMLQEYASFRQYKKISLMGYIFTTAVGDNCVKIGNKIALVRNILVKDDNVKLLVEQFNNVNSFFDYPLQSSDLCVFHVARLTGDLQVVSSETIDFKYVMLPYEEGFVVIPLIT